MTPTQRTTLLSVAFAALIGVHAAQVGLLPSEMNLQASVAGDQLRQKALERLQKRIEALPEQAKARVLLRLEKWGITLPGLHGAAGEASTSSTSVSSASYTRSRPTTRSAQSATGDTSPSTSTTINTQPHCGDSIVLDAQNEECDDGNKSDNDGCSSSCLKEKGWSCNQAQPTVCYATCGDGVVATNEKCDDGNKINGDGCSSACKIEIGYNCTGDPSVCKQPAYCGNEIVEEDEECDDGNSQPGDGCYECALEESSSSS